MPFWTIQIRILKVQIYLNGIFLALTEFGKTPFPPLLPITIARIGMLSITVKVHAL